MKNADLKIIFSFTTNTIGGFEIGDGEYFTENVNGIDDEFLILTEETEDSFILYSHPCEILENYKKEKWTDKDWIEMATHSTKQTYLKADLINYYQHAVNNDESTNFYKPASKDGIFHITDFWFYYANYCTPTITESKQLNFN